MAYSDCPRLSEVPATVGSTKIILRLTVLESVLIESFQLASGQSYSLPRSGA